MLAMQAHNAEEIAKYNEYLGLVHPKFLKHCSYSGAVRMPSSWKDVTAAWVDSQRLGSEAPLRSLAAPMAQRISEKSKKHVLLLYRIVLFNST